MKPNLSFQDIPAPSDSQYRRTVRLLKRYRNYCWQLKIAVFHASELTGIPFTDQTEQFMSEFRRQAGENSHSQLASLWNQISLLSAFLTSMDHFCALIRRYHPNGELYYWILYYTYFSSQKPESTEEILDLLNRRGYETPIRSYFRKRRHAIEVMSILIAQRSDLPFPE